MRRLLPLVVLVSMIIIFTTSSDASGYGLENDAIFRTITVSDGLSQSSAQDILVDKYGELWIGTQDGLNLYNGDSFIVYRYNEAEKNSISDNVIMELLEDSHGDIWAATMNNGLNLFNRKNNSFTRYNKVKESDSLYSNNIRDIAEGENGDIWIATDAGLNKWSRQENKIFRYSKTEGLYVERILYCDDGTVWMGTGDGLSSYSAREGVHNYPVPDISDDMVYTMAVYDKKNIIIGCASSDIMIFNKNSRSYRFYDKKDKELKNAQYIDCLYRDSRGNLWIGTYDKGLFLDRAGAVEHFTKNSDYFGSLSNDRIRRIYEDRNGLIWIGTYMNGVSVFSYDLQKFHLVRSSRDNLLSLNSNNIRGFYKTEQGVLWVATESGMCRWDDEIKGFVQYNAGKGNFPIAQSDLIRGMYADNMENIYAFTYTGVCKYNKIKDKFEIYRPSFALPDGYTVESIIAVYFDSQGTEWLATENNGVLKYNPHSKKVVVFNNDASDSNSLISDSVTRFFEDSSGRTWICTYAGVSIYTHGKTGFTNLACTPGKPNGLGGGNVFVMYEDADYYWLGIQGGGLNRIGKQDGINRVYTIKDGMPNEIPFTVSCRTGRDGCG